MRRARSSIGELLRDLAGAALLLEDEEPRVPLDDLGRCRVLVPWGDHEPAIAGAYGAIFLEREPDRHGARGIGALADERDRPRLERVFLRDLLDPVVRL